MNEKENLAVEPTAENVEQTTEQTPAQKMFTQDEVNDMMGKRVARTEAKIRKEYEKKYGDLETVLMAGTGKKSVEEVTDSFKQYYEQKGVPIPRKSEFSEKDVEVLARADADEIIRAGYDEVVEELERLTELGAANMTAREKALFKTLAEHRRTAERGKELQKLGVTEDVYNSPEFKEFAGKFSPSTPIRDIYDIYAKTQPKKDIKPMGSMKNATADDGAVKDFYTYEEAKQFTKKDFDKNPALFKAVQASMTKW